MSTSGSLFDLEKLINISKNYLSKLKASEVFNGLNEWSKEFDPEFNDLINQYKEYTISVLNIEREQKKPRKDFYIFEDEDDFDGLNFLSNQNMSEVNRRAFEGTILAHTEGGVPNIVLELPEINEYEVGYLIYFFEKACAISGYLLGVNPFNQPGVESYKKNMFALLDKPGLENMREELLKRLK